MSEKKWKALSELATKKWGYVADLVDKHGQNIVDELWYGGMINFGLSLKGKTWRISNYGLMYFKEMSLCLKS